MKTKSYCSMKWLMMFVVITLVACGGKGTNENNKGESTQINSATKPLNISIYLDLSDRLERQMTPSQKDRDIEIVNYMTEILKNHAVSQKILPSKDRIKVFFYPTPNDSKIDLLSKDLEMDLSKAQPAEKKQLLLEFQKR